MLFRFLFEVLLFYLAYKVIKWILTSNRRSVSGRRTDEADFREDDIEDAEYHEIKD